MKGYLLNIRDMIFSYCNDVPQQSKLIGTANSNIPIYFFSTNENQMHSKSVIAKDVGNTFSLPYIFQKNLKLGESIYIIREFNFAVSNHKLIYNTNMHKRSVHGHLMGFKFVTLDCSIALRDEYKSTDHFAHLLIKCICRERLKRYRNGAGATSSDYFNQNVLDFVKIYLDGEEVQ